MAYPKSLNNLIENFKLLPGIGEKTAERLALAMVNFDKARLISFATSINNVKDKITRCSICNNLSENIICDICSDNNREKDTICVVEDVKDVILFEKNGLFHGLYHVLNGLISPANGIDPNDINIESLIDRVHKDNTKEVIIAVKPSIEGEATTLYISKRLSDTDTSISKIAHGIPMGTDMEYIDTITLETALLERKKIS